MRPTVRNRFRPRPPLWARRLLGARPRGRRARILVASTVGVSCALAIHLGWEAAAFIVTFLGVTTGLDGVLRSEPRPASSRTGGR